MAAAVAVVGDFAAPKDIVEGAAMDIIKSKLKSRALKGIDSLTREVIRYAKRRWNRT
jgi:hypothetical protein